MDINPSELTARVYAGAEGPVVELAGTMDLATLETARDALREGVTQALAEPACPAMTVDLRGVGFIDLSGLAVLADARRRLTHAGPSLRVLLRQGGQPDAALRRGDFGKILALVYEDAP